MALPGVAERKDRFEQRVPELDVLLPVALSLTRSPPKRRIWSRTPHSAPYRGMHRFDGERSRAWLLTILVGLD